MNKLKNLKNKQLNPAQVLVLGFFAIIIVGALLLNTPIASADGNSVGFVNAVFTSTSAVCVTGLVVVDTGTHWTIFGQVVILCLIQIGGLGIMTMAMLVAFVTGKRVSLRGRLMMQEELSQFTIAGVVRLTKYILITTFLIEGIGALLLMTRFIPIYGIKKGIYFGIFHSISAFCNAGFDLVGGYRSLTPFANDIVINFTIMALIILGGLGFVVILELRKKKKFSLHTKLVLVMTGILLAIGFALFFALEYTNPATLGNLSLPEKILAALFQSVTPRTAGFNTISTGDLTMTSKFLTVVLMFIGGSPGSTAGGIKTTTLGIIVLSVISVIRGHDDTEFANRRISKITIQRALAILAIAIFVLISITMILTITESGSSFIDIFFETASAFGTVGLSVGVSGKLTTIGKIIISLTMFMGRVGPLTMVVALAQVQKKKKGQIRYPKGKVMVG